MLQAHLALAVQALLVCFAGAESQETLIGRLKDADADIRRLAAEALGNQKAEAAIPALVDLLKDKEKKVVRAASNALIQIGPKAIPALASGLNWPDSDQRRSAAFVLYRLASAKKVKPSPEVLMVLSNALKDKDVDVRIHAAATLGKFGKDARSALPALFAVSGDTSNVGAVLRSKMSSSVAESAIEAALEIDPACATELAKAALPKLIAALDSKDKAILQAAGYALSKLGPQAKPAVPALQAARKRASGFAEDAITSALKAIDGESLQLLFDSVKDPKISIEKRRRTLSELSWTKAPNDKVVALFVELLRDPEPEIRASAVQGLSRLSPKPMTVLPILLEMLGDEEVERAEAKHQKGADDLIPRTIASLGKEAVPGLAGVLQDEKKKVFVRFRAARTLTILGRKAKDALPALEAGMKDRFAAVAVESACAYVLAGGSLDKAMPALRDGLKHSAGFIVWLSASSFERLGYRAKAAVPSLMRLLEHKDGEVRIVAARALAKMGSAARPAVPAMAELLKADDGRQRFQVGHALEQLGPDASAALPVLIERLADLEEMSPHPVLVAIGNLGAEGKDAVPALLKLLKPKKKSGLLADDAVKVLGRIGPAAKAAVPEILKRLESKESYTRQYAAQALGQIGPDAKDAIPILKKLLQDEEQSVRIWAAFALARITGETKLHVARMIEQWKESDQEDRFSGSGRFELAEIFALLGSEARPALDLLLSAAADEKTSPGTHRQVLMALGRLPGEADRIVPKLVILLERKGKRFERIDCCVHVAEALGQLGPMAKAAVPQLRKLLEDEEDEIATAALRALEKVEGK